MAFSHGVKARFYFNAFNFSPYLEEIDPQFQRDSDAIKTLTVEWDQQVMGHRQYTVTLNGLFTGDTTGPDERAWDAFDDGLNHIFAHLPQGDAIAGIAYCGQSKGNQVKISIGSKAVRMPVGAVGTEDVDRCTIFHALGAETSSDSEASQDNTSGTTTGSASYLICTALTGGQTLDVKIEQSANNSDWTDLAVFTQLAAVGEEIKETTSTVARYLRVTWTLSGGSATFFVAVARR